MTADTVAEAISRAFEDVPAPEGGISSCRCSQCAERDASFRGRTWKSITLEQVGRHPLHASRFTPQAFRHYLPAYLLLALGDTEEARESRFCTVFALGPGDPDYPTIRAEREARNGTFGPSQVKAIVAFLEHVSLTDGDVREDARLARDEVWSPLLRTMTETRDEKIERLIHALIERAADRCSASLAKFRPWRGENAMARRNLAFQLATEFVRRFPDAAAFMGGPLASRDGRRIDARLDACLFSAKLTVLLECRRARAKEDLASVAEGMARLSPALLGQLRTFHRSPGSPGDDAVGMILVETWRLEDRAWWCGKTAGGSRWPPDLLPGEGWTFGARSVFEEHDGPGSTLSWLYAFKRLA